MRASRAVIADNSVAGPFNQVDEDRIYLYQRKEWFANVDGFKQLIDKKDLRTVHIPGMGVQLSAWTGYSWCARRCSPVDADDWHSTPCWHNAKTTPMPRLTES